MNLYKVVAADPATAILAIQDATGLCHVGRALALVPQDGDLLCGDAPAIGLRLLHLTPTEKPCPVVLVVLNCEPGPARLVVTVPRVGDGRGPSG